MKEFSYNEPIANSDLINAEDIVRMAIRIHAHETNRRRGGYLKPLAEIAEELYWARIEQLVKERKLYPSLNVRKRNKQKSRFHMPIRKRIVQVSRHQCSLCISRMIPAVIRNI